MRMIELVKKGRGFLPASEDAAAFHGQHEDGEVLTFEEVKARDVTAHRRYWKLCTLCAENCERIELPNGGVIEVKSKDDIHLALKILTGHVTPILDETGKPVYFVPKSTDFRSMKPAEWEKYWPLCLEAVGEHILPGVVISELETEILKCMGWAS